MMVRVRVRSKFRVRVKIRIEVRDPLYVQRNQQIVQIARLHLTSIHGNTMPVSHVLTFTTLITQFPQVVFMHFNITLVIYLENCELYTYQ